jgi:hypothetical protein
MQREASQEPVLRGAAAAAHTPLQSALDWLDDPPDMGAKRAPTSTPWTMRGCLVSAARYSGPRQFRMPVRQLSPDGISGAGPTVVAEVWWPRMPRRTA